MSEHLSASLKYKVHILTHVHKINTCPPALHTVYGIYTGSYYYFDFEFWFYSLCVHDRVCVIFDCPGWLPWTVFNVSEWIICINNDRPPASKLRKCLMGNNKSTLPGLIAVEDIKVTTLYCGGEAEHKDVANKYMCEEIHAYNNSKLY